jgi:hypothetical protein
VFVSQELWGTLQGCLGYGGEELIHIPRGPRLDTPGVLHHVMTRGLEQQQIIRDHIVWSGSGLLIYGSSG